MSREDLEHIRSVLGELREAIDAVYRKRVDIAALMRRIDVALDDPDKTPVRPPSQHDMKAAFRSSGEFEAPVDPTRRKR